MVDGSTEILSDEIYSPLMGIDSIKLVVALKRKVWENTSSTSVNKTSLSVTGGTASIGNDVGTLNQRIERMTIVANSVAKSKYWIGIRPTYKGVADFDPVWECEDGTNHLADTTDEADGGASGGNLVRIAFTSETVLTKRFSINIDDVIGANDYTHFVGKYQILCRCKVDASGTQVRLQLRSGLFYSTDEVDTVVQDTIVDGQTEWNLIELGEVQFPPMGNRDDYADNKLKYATLGIWAERLSGSGTVDLDVFILMPSEHLFTCTSLDQITSSGPEAYVTPLDNKYAVGSVAGFWGNAEYNMPNWEYPIGGGIMVTAAEAAVHNLGGTLDVTLYLRPRWQSYRA